MFIERDPHDRYAFLKGVLKTNQWFFLMFGLLRFILGLEDIIRPLLLVKFLDWLQDKKVDDTWESTCWAVLTAMLIPFLQALKVTIWEQACYRMHLVGHRAHTSLKTILFAKDLRMSNATNKDFSEGEISAIIMSDTDRIWDFVWQIPDLFEVPVLLFASCYFTFANIGKYGFLILLITALQFAMSYLKEWTEKNIKLEARDLTDKRISLINECFQNIKGVKLYGWEQKFLAKIEDIYGAETALFNRCELRNLLYLRFAELM